MQEFKRSRLFPEERRDLLADAAYERDFEKVQEVLLDDPEHDMTDALRIAVNNGSHEIALYLMQRGANVNSPRYTLPLLTSAVARGDTRMSFNLIKSGGASLKDIDRELRFVRRNGREYFEQALLRDQAVWRETRAPRFYPPMDVEEPVTQFPITIS